MRGKFGQGGKQMNGISGIGHKTGEYWRPRAEEKAKKGITEKQDKVVATVPEEKSLQKAVLENVRLAASDAVAAPAEKDWAEAVEDYLRQLQNQYPGVDFKVITVDEAGDLKKFAASAGAGLHLAVGADFLAKMAVGEDAFTKGKSFIEKILKDLLDTEKDLNIKGVKLKSLGVAVTGSGTVSVWTVQPPPDDYLKKSFDIINNGGMVNYTKEKGGRQVTEIKTPDGIIRFVVTKRLGYAPGRDLARLAQIRQVGGVRSFLGGMHANLNKIRGDQSLDEKERKIAVAQIEGVIRRAQSKVKNLNSESILAARRRHATESANIKRAQALAEELKRRRTARKSREYAQINDRFLPLPEELLRSSKYEADLRREEAAAAAAALAAPTVDLSLPASAITAAVAPADVAVVSQQSFNILA